MGSTGSIPVLRCSHLTKWATACAGRIIRPRD